MKKIIIILNLIIFLGCEGPNIQSVKPKNCSLPAQYTNLDSHSVVSHFAGKLSPDGNKLFFTIDIYDVKILDLKTLQVNKINFQSLLPKKYKINYFDGRGQLWCPYDNSKFIANYYLGVDTVGDGTNYYGGYHLMIISLDDSNSKDITPKLFGPTGSQQYPLGCACWLPSSTKGNDQFYIDYKDLNENNVDALYTPSTQNIKPIVFNGLKDYTYDGKYFFYASNPDSISGYNYSYYINDKRMIFKDIALAKMGEGTLSPDGKHFAISAIVTINYLPVKEERLAEIWIVDVEKFMQNPIQPVPTQIINIKDRFCMFSNELCPVFTSNNTIAVSMFHAGDNFAYLYEIDLNGNMIKQLTFTP